MNPFLEALIKAQISAAIFLLIASVKNQQHAAEFKPQLLGVADSIYQAYGLTPLQHD